MVVLFEYSVNVIMVKKKKKTKNHPITNITNCETIRFFRNEKLY